MSGVKGRSGRRRNVKNALRYFNELYDLNSYDLAETTIKKALDGDREMLIYCHDRRLGKPKSTTELDIQGGERLGIESTKTLLAAMHASQREFLTTESIPLLPESIPNDV